MIGGQRSQLSSGQQSSGLHLLRVLGRMLWMPLIKCSGCPLRYAFSYYGTGGEI